MSRFAALMPITSGIMWGSVGVFMRKLDAFGMDNFTVLFVRMTFGVMLMFAGIILVNKNLLKVRKKDIGLMLLGAIGGNFGLSYFYNEAMIRLSLSFAAVLLSTFPIFVMFFAAILFKEKITGRKIICIFIAIAGCVLVSGFLEAKGEITWTAAGVAIGVAASLCYGLYSVFSKMLSERGYHSITITFYFMLVIGVVATPFADFGMVGEFIKAAPAANIAFLFLHSAICAVIPYVIYTMSFRYMDSGKAAILAAIEPAAATVFGAVFFNEIPTVLMIAGVFVTISALVVLCMPEKAGR